MPVQTVEIEGTWEEVAARAEEFAGRRVRLVIFADAEAQTPVEGGTLSEKNRRMLEWVRERETTPLTEEEVAVLEDFEQFRKEHPFSLRRNKKP